MSDLTAKWVDDADVPKDSECISWLGGDFTNPTWKEYVANFGPELRPVLEAVKACCEREDLDLYGEDMNDGAFLLSDGRNFSLSWRAWGDFRQAMVGKREGYMKYYMRR